jgi:hypothetical protein
MGKWYDPRCWAKRATVFGTRVCRLIGAQILWVTATSFTVIWVWFTVHYYLRSGGDLFDLKLNEFGDFMAGVAAPPALVWLIVGYLHQAREFSLQRKEFAEVVSSNKRIEAANHPCFYITYMANSSGPTTRFVVQNQGGIARDVMVRIDELGSDGEYSLGLMPKASHDLVDYRRKMSKAGIPVDRFWIRASWDDPLGTPHFQWIFLDTTRRDAMSSRLHDVNSERSTIEDLEEWKKGVTPQYGSPV